jgi:hypothetical protein
MFSTESRGGIGLSADLVLYLGVAVMTVVNLVLVVPAIWAAFFWPFLSKALLWGTLAIAFVTAIECWGIWMLVRSKPDVEDVLVFWFLNLAQVLTVYVVLRLLRRVGFQLVRILAT